MPAKTASNLMIARRASIKARADFATWLMMEKLRSVSSLTPEAQDFLAKYHKLCGEMADEAAAEAVMRQVYARYYAEMGGTGDPPEIDASKVAASAKPGANRLTGTPTGTDAGGTGANEPGIAAMGDNVTPFRKVKPAPPKGQTRGQTGPAKPKKLPVTLIFMALVAVAVAFKYLMR